jgi:histidyl-tRNA synthetase
MLNQLQYCEETGIPIAIIIGESELQKGVVKLRVIETRDEIEVPKSELVETLKAKIAELKK